LTSRILERELGLIGLIFASRRLGGACQRDGSLECRWSSCVRRSLDFLCLREWRSWLGGDDQDRACNCEPPQTGETE